MLSSVTTIKKSGFTSFMSLVVTSYAIKCDDNKEVRIHVIYVVMLSSVKEVRIHHLCSSRHMLSSVTTIKKSGYTSFMFVTSYAYQV